MAAKLTVFERAEVEEEVQSLLASGTWSLTQARRIALERGLSLTSIYVARSRVVSRMSRLRASDLEGERALALMQLDAVIEKGLSTAGGKAQLSAVVAAIRLRLQATGLLDRPPEEGDGGTGTGADDLLDLIEKARRLGEQVTSPTVHEDEEEPDTGEEE